MSTARSDLLLFIAVALSTTVGLFVLHKWYASYLDVQYHAELDERAPSEALQAAREEEQKLLAAGKVPLAQAIDTVARQGRPASITPAPSDDLSPVSGWIQAKGFKPATAHPVRGTRNAPRQLAPIPVGTQGASATQVPGGAAPATAPSPLQLRTVFVKPEAVR